MLFRSHNAEFTNCTFNHNANNPTFEIRSLDQSVSFTGCDLGDSVFNDRSRATFDGKHAASIFGEGSLSMIVAIVALIAAAASIWVNVSSKKKALAVGEAENAEESETEESAE